MTTNVLVDVTDGQSLRIGQKLKQDGWNVLYSPKEKISDVAAVFGKIDFTYEAMDNAGIVRPEVLKYPFWKNDTFSFALYNRRCKIRRLGEVRKHLIFNKGKLFIKPVKNLKLFTGVVVSDLDDDYFLSRIHFDTPVWVSEPCDITFEWRVLVCHGKRLAQPCYSDDMRELTSCELKLVDEFIETCNLYLPAAYSMDVGIVNNKLAIVEFNDGWSLGGYGQDDAIIEVVFARFEELNKGKK